MKKNLNAGSVMNDEPRPRGPSCIKAVPKFIAKPFAGRRQAWQE